MSIYILKISISIKCYCEKAASCGLKHIKEKVEKWDKDKQELIYFGKIGDCQKQLWFLMETASWVMGEPSGTCMHTKPIRTVLTSLFPASVRRGNKRAGTGLLREPVSAGLFFNWTGEKQTGMGKRNCVQNRDSHTETVKQRPQGPKTNDCFHIPTHKGREKPK